MAGNYIMAHLDPMEPDETDPEVALSLQLSINKRLMERIETLEKEMDELRRNVKNLSHMMPV